MEEDIGVRGGVLGAGSFGGSGGGGSGRVGHTQPNQRQARPPVRGLVGGARSHARLQNARPELALTLTANNAHPYTRTRIRLHVRTR